MAKTNSEPILCPFVILIDSAEGQPFSFDGLHGDGRHAGRPLIVRTEFVCLGRFPNSLGDYSIRGFEGRIGVERKSLEDLQGTVLGWPSSSDVQAGRQGRRDRFEQELSNLNKLEQGHVVVEAELSQVLAQMPAYGVKSEWLNRKIFYRSILAYSQDYPRVQWHFCAGRRFAEFTTFYLLKRFWKHHRKGTRE